jgi:hypothetical protein
MDDGFSNGAAFGDKILAKEDNEASAPMMPPSAPPTAMSPTPHCPTTYKDVVLATMGGSLRAKSLVVASLSCLSTMVDDQPQTVCVAAGLVPVLATAMAPGLPIHRSSFFAGGNIGPALPTNLLRMDGLKRG